MIYTVGLSVYVNKYRHSEVYLMTLVQSEPDGISKLILYRDTILRNKAK